MGYEKSPPPPQHGFRAQIAPVELLLDVYLENGVVPGVGGVVCSNVVERAPRREGNARFETVFAD